VFDLGAPFPKLYELGIPTLDRGDVEMIVGPIVAEVALDEGDFGCTGSVGDCREDDRGGMTIFCGGWWGLELAFENTSGISGLDGLLPPDDIEVNEVAELGGIAGEAEPDSWYVVEDSDDVLSLLTFLRYANCRPGVEGSLRSRMGLWPMTGSS
jgi:hypothetical protein